MESDPAQEVAAQIELMRQIGTGDRQSFAALYDRFAGILFAVAYRILNQREAAEDVLQEVFLQLWEKAPLYDASRGKPLSWAVTLTRNKAIDRLRATQRRSRLQDEAQRESDIVEPLSATSSFEAVTLQESRALVRAAMQKLSADQRESIELAFFSLLTQAEIAERLNEPLGTIKARIRRGILKMREVISPEA